MACKTGIDHAAVEYAIGCTFDATADEWPTATQVDNAMENVLEYEMESYLGVTLDTSQKYINCLVSYTVDWVYMWRFNKNGGASSVSDGYGGVTYMKKPEVPSRKTRRLLNACRSTTTISAVT